jgi:hypothetical protein
VEENRAVADPAVMGDMRIGHDVVIVPDKRQAPSFNRPSVDGYEFAEHVPVADFHPRFFAFVPDVLGFRADGRERRKTAVRTDLREPSDADMGVQSGILTDDDVLADNAVWAYPNACVKLRS